MSSRTVVHPHLVIHINWTDRDEQALRWREGDRPFFKIN